MLEPINVFSHIHLAGWGWVSHNVEPSESWVAWVQGRVRRCQPSSVCDPECRSGPPDPRGPFSVVSQSVIAGRVRGCRLVPGAAPQESRLRQQHSSPRAGISPIGTLISPAASEARVPVKC